jgi:hypothetical protein
MTKPGKVALDSGNCRSSWDDVVLDQALSSNLSPAREAVIVPSGPTLPTIELAQPAAAVKAAQLTSYSLGITQSFTNSELCWMPQSGAWQRTAEGRYGFSSASSGESFFTLGQFSDTEIEASLSLAELETNSAEKAVGLYARYKDKQNYVFFGVVGLGEDKWTLQLTTCKDGEKKTVAVPGEPYALRARSELVLTLVVAGDRACGYLNERPLLSVDRLKTLAPDIGKVGLVVRALAASFDKARVRAAQTSQLEGPDWAAAPGAVPLKVPKGVKAQPVEPPAIIEVSDSGIRYVTVRDIVSRDATISVQVKLKDLQSFPQFALCGAAKGDRDVMVAMLVDLDRRGSASLTLAGTLPYRGSLKTAFYDRREKVRVDLSKPVRFTLALKGNRVECSLNDEPPIAYQPGPIPLPAEPGVWGFRNTDVTATIEQIDIEL